jgi:hypothetical protein
VECRLLSLRIDFAEKLLDHGRDGRVTATARKLAVLVYRVLSGDLI